MRIQSILEALCVISNRFPSSNASRISAVFFLGKRFIALQIIRKNSTAHTVFTLLFFLRNFLHLFSHLFSSLTSPINTRVREESARDMPGSMTSCTSPVSYILAFLTLLFGIGLMLIAHWSGSSFQLLKFLADFSVFFSIKRRVQASERWWGERERERMAGTEQTKMIYVFCAIQTNYGSM